MSREVRELKALKSDLRSSMTTPKKEGLGVKGTANTPRRSARVSTVPEERMGRTPPSAVKNRAAVTATAAAAGPSTSTAKRPTRASTRKLPDAAIANPVTPTPTPTRKSLRARNTEMVTPPSKSEASEESEDEPPAKKRVNKKATPMKTPMKDKENRAEIFSPIKTPGTVWRFNSVGVPECPVPCRETQFEEIWTLLLNNVKERSSMGVYVSGVPGTGKTLIVQTVVDTFSRYTQERKRELQFKNAYINGVNLGSPDKVWKRFWAQIDGEKHKLTSAVALKKLNAYFETKGRVPVVLVIDELDQLLDKKQAILYQLLDWTIKPSNMFSLIAIFNTMNLPEEMLVNRNASRAQGISRVIFPPYTHDQLQTIIKRSLQDCKSDKIKDDAIVLLSRKVAAVSGDARRALELARRAVEIVESGQESTGVMGVNAAFKEIFSSVKTDTMKNCSALEQTILKALTKELESSGSDTTTLMSIFDTITTNLAYSDYQKWSKNQFMVAITKLMMMKLILTENDGPSLFKKISLNVPFEDVNFSLGLQQTV